jgi:hypothetical protein
MLECGNEDIIRKWWLLFFLPCPSFGGMVLVSFELVVPEFSFTLTRTGGYDTESN